MADKPTYEDLEARIEYLVQEHYKIAPDCVEVEYSCDYKIDGTKECVCMWALKLKPDFYPDKPCSHEATDE